MPDKIKPPPFDLEKVYDEQIAPLMSQIIEICKQNNMPMFATFAYRITEDGKLDCCTTNLPAETNDGPWAPVHHAKCIAACYSAPESTLAEAVAKQATKEPK